MAEYLDFFNIYIMGVVEMTFQFYFLAKILKKKIWSPLKCYTKVVTGVANEI